MIKSGLFLSTFINSESLCYENQKRGGKKTLQLIIFKCKGKTEGGIEAVMKFSALMHKNDLPQHVGIPLSTNNVCL